MICDAFEHKQLLEWQRTRNIEFALYNVQYGAMNGKKIFKNIKSPQDLYTLPSDNIIKHKVADYTPEKVKELQEVMDNFKKDIINR